MNVLLTVAEAAGLQALKLVDQSSHHLSGVVTHGNNKGIKNTAKRLNIPVLETDLLTRPEFAEWVRTHKIDVLLNVHLLVIIHPEIIQSVKVGAFNLHPGKLPEYAGLNTPSWAIYNGETTQTVTLHKIEATIDTGNIIYTSSFNIDPRDTGLSLSLKSAQKGLELIKQLLDTLKLNPESLPALPQQLSKRWYYGKYDSPGNGFICWSDSSYKIDSLIRAFNYHPFPSPWDFAKALYLDEEISIVSSVLTNECSKKSEPGLIGSPVDDYVPVATGDYWLHVKDCSIDGKIMPAKNLLTTGEYLKY